MTIRRAIIEDASILSELVHENAKVVLGSHYSPLQLETFLKYYSIEMLRNKISTQDVFCAILNEQIVGTIALDKDYVVGFYTRVQNLRQGIGKKLMTYLEEYAKDKGVGTLLLSSSPEGLLFYLKNGWKIEKDLVFEYLGVGFDEKLMSKKNKIIH